MIFGTVPWDSRWKQIPGFPNYWVSNYGQVFNMKRRRLMALQSNQDGVITVNLWGKLGSEHAKTYNRGVDKMVRELFWEDELHEQSRAG